MNLFHVYADRVQGERPGPRKWLVVADSLFEALSLIPRDRSVKAIEVQIGNVAGPVRLIGAMGARTVH